MGIRTGEYSKSIGSTGINWRCEERIEENNENIWGVAYEKIKGKESFEKSNQKYSKENRWYKVENLVYENR